MMHIAESVFILLSYLFIIPTLSNISMVYRMYNYWLPFVRLKDEIESNSDIPH